ncbi:MAG: hypothetical protein JSV19_02645 [Phycisphaerales bacterium]|nr:MAG: hypothetical protein JSV19_02645 [Phycisphaerales bacterium]
MKTSSWSWFAGRTTRRPPFGKFATSVNDCTGNGKKLVGQSIWCRPIRASGGLMVGIY